MITFGCKTALKIQKIAFQSIRKSEIFKGNIPLNPPKGFSHLHHLPISLVDYSTIRALIELARNIDYKSSVFKSTISVSSVNSLGRGVTKDVLALQHWKAMLHHCSVSIQQYSQKLSTLNILKLLK